MTPPRLSVCIATMNRADFIGETLESILGQATDEVEVVILDGGSRDGTTEVVRGFQARHPRIRYVRQDRPGGADQDYNRAVDLAEGEYCWLFTDDDLLKPGAIRRVLEAIRSGYDLVVVNAEVRNADLSQVVQERRMRMKDDRIYGPGDWGAFFANSADYLSFIGGVVIRRSLWRSRGPEKYYGSLFIHIGVLFQEPLPGRILAIADPLVSIRYGNAHWISRAFEIWMILWPKLIWSIPFVSESCKSLVYPREPWMSYRKLILQRAFGWYSLEDYRKWILPRAGGRLRRTISRMIAILPGCLVNLAFLIYELHRGRRTMLHIDLVRSRFHYSRFLRRRP